MDVKPICRRYDIDWLRVLAILSVFIYHTTRFFNSEYWIVKNPSSYFAMDALETILANWIMALIFTISGASLFFALDKGGVGKFIMNKFLRLVVPLVGMGMIVFGMLQIYLDRLSHGRFSGSLIDFIPLYFQPASFAWKGVHLWYLGMLFVFCLVFLPFFLWFKRGSAQGVLDRLGDSFASRGRVYLLAVPTILCLVLTERDSFLGNTDWGGGSILSHATFFLSGFVIISHKGLQKTIQRNRWLSVVLVVVLLVTLFYLMTAVGAPSTGTLLYALGRTLWGFWSWCWVLAILGFGMKHLNNNKTVLSYANEAVLPFYILHQPVLLCVGYFIVRWNIPAAVKFVTIDAISFAIIMILYEIVVRQLNPLRILFGMRTLTRTPITHIKEVEVT